MENPKQETVLQTGKPVPEFDLPDLKGDRHTLSEFRGRILIVNFWSAECPWSARSDRELRTLLEQWGARVALVTVASNANEPVELIRRVAGEQRLPFVLLDPDHHLADLYGAQTTPHLFVIDLSSRLPGLSSVQPAQDIQGILRYQGAFDDVTFRRRTPLRFYLRDAVEALLAGRLPDLDHTLPYGCAIVRYSHS